ncbi:hypothetical protein pb186bvf_020958 [Paramecium bursaria]
MKFDIIKLINQLIKKKQIMCLQLIRPLTDATVNQ